MLNQTLENLLDPIFIRGPYFLPLNKGQDEANMRREIVYSCIVEEFSILICPRNDEWNSDRPKEDGSKYDGPAGMEPDGVIDSNWDEVSLHYVWKNPNKMQHGIICITNRISNSLCVNIFLLGTFA